ncbi:BAH domain-containing protein [Fusarium falciforme]|uniref:BAH domain-containing protein n=1 Tax=Fusarium falciforme TaxID=195108 RepID=UPI002301C82A|nr:BAH domain-containing protein [Fusarium falciforme]WAO97139.1 BAH domain-containing protein [Fusarium falciforme]
MGRYNSFILKDKKFQRGDFVLVANETTRERTNNARSSKQMTGESSRFWIAYILEIRAANENRVFARVY